MHCRDNIEIILSPFGQGRVITSLTVVFNVGFIASKYAPHKLEFKNAIALMVSSELNAINVGEPELYK